MYIGNARFESFKAIFLGYIPTKNHYSIVQRHKILENMGYVYKNHREYIIQMQDRSDYLSYIYNAIQPVLNKAFFAQVGTGDCAVSYKFYPFLVSYLGDTVEMNYISGVGQAGKYMKCRLCTETNCAKFSRYNQTDAALPREVYGHEELGFRLLSSELRHINRCREYRKHFHLPTSLKRLRHQAKIHSLSPGLNDLFHLPPKLVDEDEDEMLSFYSMFVPDNLHTFLLGLLLNNIGWTLLLIVSFGKFDPAYVHSLSLLESIIKDMNTHESLLPTPDVDFKDVSDMLKATILKQKIKPYLGILRTIAAWKLPALLMKLMFAIGSEGRIVPNRGESWYKDNNIYMPDIAYNPTVIILNALSSALELYWILRSSR